MRKFELIMTRFSLLLQNALLICAKRTLILCIPLRLDDYSKPLSVKNEKDSLGGEQNITDETAVDSLDTFTNDVKMKRQVGFYREGKSEVAAFSYRKSFFHLKSEHM